MLMLVEILKLMLGRDSEGEIWSRFMNLWYDFKKLLWQDELNPRVLCAFGNVYILTQFWETSSPEHSSGHQASRFGVYRLLCKKNCIRLLRAGKSFDLMLGCWTQCWTMAAPGDGKGPKVCTRVILSVDTRKQKWIHGKHQHAEVCTRVPLVELNIEPFIT